MMMMMMMMMILILMMMMMMMFHGHCYSTDVLVVMTTFASGFQTDVCCDFVMMMMMMRPLHNSVAAMRMLLL
jgi:hypothetical protein